MKTRRILSFILVLMIAASAIALVSCAEKKTEAQPTTAAQTTPVEKTTAVEKTAETEETAGEQTTAAESTTATADEKTTSHITFIVVDADGKETTFEIDTEEEFLRGALEAKELIKGDESEYGLMVNEVNGIKADYTADGAYWALYIGEEYAMTGVDSTPITDGQTYRFVYTKA